MDAELGTNGPCHGTPTLAGYPTPGGDKPHGPIAGNYTVPELLPPLKNPGEETTIVRDGPVATAAA